MDHGHFAIRLFADLPHLRALTGDRLLIRVGHVEPILLVRALVPNYGAIVEALSRGHAFPVDRGQPVEEITRQLVFAGGSRPLPSPLPPPDPRGHRPRVLRFPARER